MINNLWWHRTADIPVVEIDDAFYEGVILPRGNPLGRGSQDCVKVGEVKDLNAYAAEAHANNRTWWHDPETGERVERDPLTMIVLMHSELSEMVEGIRKDLPDDHLPHRPAEHVELADLIIRALDYAGGRGIDIQAVYDEKIAYNRTRADHKPENRLKSGGKRF